VPHNPRALEYSRASRVFDLELYHLAIAKQSDADGDRQPLKLDSRTWQAQDGIGDRDE